MLKQFASLFVVLVVVAAGAIVLRGDRCWVTLPFGPNELVRYVNLYEDTRNEERVTLNLGLDGYFHITQQSNGVAAVRPFLASGFVAFAYRDVWIQRKTGSDVISVIKGEVSPSYYRFDQRRHVWQRWACKRPPGDNRWF